MTTANRQMFKQSPAMSGPSMSSYEDPRYTTGDEDEDEDEDFEIDEDFENDYE